MLLFRLVLVILILYKVSTSSYPISECVNIENEHFVCHNGGTCLQIELNSTTTTRICQCKPGFTGRQCAQRTMPCSPDPCAPNGYCNSGDETLTAIDNYFCRCKPGYTGVNCQENINDCLNATCHNGGSCVDGINSYTCDCKWPYIGRYCQTQMKCNSENNEATCKNKGVCVDEERGPRCLCPRGFQGDDCSIRVDQCLSSPCLNNGKCVWLKLENDYKCECLHGFTGKMCQLNDVCTSSYSNNKMPCKNNSTCISLLHKSIQSVEKLGVMPYYCQCMPRFTGINCDLKIWCSPDSNEDFGCFQKPKITTTNKTFITTTTLSPFKSTNDTGNTITSNNNGSFVLIVNISPDEFRSRQAEIIREFEKKLGILMLIKKDTVTSNDMIYPFYSNKQQEKLNGTPWTKVYFIIIFACVYDETLQKSANNSICLQNNLSDMNDPSEIVSELKKAATNSLLPTYVSNITYEAYSSDSKKKKNEIDDTFPNKDTRNNNDTWSTTLVIILAIGLLIGISLALTVLIRQNAITKRMMIKAPIWYPPPLDGQQGGFKKCPKIGEYSSKEGVIEMMSQQSTAPLKFANHGEDPCSLKNKTTSWSFNKKIDEISNLFHFSHKPNNLKVKITNTDETNSCPITSDSGFSSNSSSQSKDTNINEYSMYADLTLTDPPNKMRKLDTPIYSQVNHQTISQSSSAASSTSSSPSNQNHLKSNTPSILIFPPPSLPNSTTKSPEYYPSPPESIPDTSSFIQVNHRVPQIPINFKGAAYGITPLMVFITSRNKAKMSNGQEQQGKSLNSGAEAEIIDTFFNNGADVNAQNGDGETALHIAARCGLYEICERLIKNGALLNLHDNYGRNVLHTAVCSNELNIVKLILNYCSLVINAMNPNNNTGSSNVGLENDEKYDLIDSKTNDDLNETSLIIASRLNLNGIVQLLVDFNATINATDSEGRSALHWCSKVNNFNGALILLQSGANVNMQDNDEKTPLSSALSELCTQQVVELLIKYDAFVSTDDEVKYNKMKSILEANTNLFQNKIDFSKHVKKEKTQNNLGNELKSTNLLLTTASTKENNQNNVSKKAKTNSVSTKRKLSETFTNSSSNENGTYVDNQNLRNNKISKTNKKNALNVNTNGNGLKTPAYTPLTPSPPQPYNTTQYHHSPAVQNGINNCYSSYNTNNLPSQNQYFSQNQQMYANPAFSYSFENTESIMNRKPQSYLNENLAYSESNNKLNYSNQQYHQNNCNYKPHVQSHLELQNNSIYTTSNNLYFNTNLNETYAAYF